MKPNLINILPFSGTGDLSEIMTLRSLAWHEYFKNNQGKRNHSLTDSLDLQAYHWALCFNGKIIGAARLNLLRGKDQIYPSRLYQILQKIPSDYLKEHAWPIAYFSRLVVHPNFRKSGLSNLLYQARFDCMKKHGATTAFMTTIHSGLQSSLLRKNWQLITSIPGELFPQLSADILIYQSKEAQAFQPITTPNKFSMLPNECLINRPF